MNVNVNGPTEPTREDALESIKFLEFMIKAKQQQVKDEPKEPMWEDQLKQLYGAQELIKLDLEFFETKHEQEDLNYQRGYGY